jgi:hypothetical protein
MRRGSAISADLLDFTGVSADPGTVFAEPGAAINGGVLEVQGASGDQASLRTTALGLTFGAGSDQDGGTIVTVACFRHGARIATPSGERPVQALRIGDEVATFGGGVRRIRWLGRREYPAALVARQPQLRPVRIAAGALGGGLPRRALFVSPLHAMLIDGLLIPVAALVDELAIRRARVADVEYVHVELDTPDIILAEGAPTESFVDCDSRAMFDNAAEFAALYPDAIPMPWRFPRPRVEEGWRLEAIRARLAGSDATSPAGGRLCGHLDVVTPGRIEGWAMNEADPARPVAFEVVAGGVQIGCLIANRYRIDLDHAGIGHARHGFTADLPDLGAESLASLALIRLSDGAELGR